MVQECTTFTLSVPIQLKRYIHAPPCRILTLSNPVYVHTRCPPRSDARTRSRASTSLDRGRSTPRDGTRRGASTDDRSRTPAVVVGARRTPRTRSLGRARGTASSEGNGAVTREGVVCVVDVSRSSANDGRWRTRTSDETNARLYAFEASWRSGGVEGARPARDARGATARGVRRRERGGG